VVQRKEAPPKRLIIGGRLTRRLRLQHRTAIPMDNASIRPCSLDIDLQGTKAFMVADALMERRIGFIFASGYDEVVILARLSRVIRCTKPANAAGVADAVGRVCGA